MSDPLSTAQWNTESRLYVAARILASVRNVVRNHRLTLAAFLVPLTIRSIPEIIAGPYPVGYDTITAYVPLMRDWASGNTGAQFNPAIGGWLLFVVFGLIYSATHVDPIIIAKIAAPLLYGGLGVSEYAFARRVLGWNARKSLLLILIASSYFVSLRISWDLFRNTLALALMLLALVVGQNVNTRRRLLSFSVMVVLVATAHLLVATLLIVLVVLGDFPTKKPDWRRISAALPGAIYCAYSVVGLWIAGTSAVAIVEGGPQPISALYPIYLFLPLIPMAVLGSRNLRSKLLNLWLLVCGVVVVVATIPFSVSILTLSQGRWALIMFLPVVILSAEGVSRLRSSLGPALHWKPIAIGWMFVVVLLGSVYVGLPAREAFPYYQFLAPTSMLQSTVPLEDSRNVIGAFEWLSANISPGSVIMTTDPMYGWAREYFKGNAPILHFYPGVTLGQGLQVTIQRGYTRIFTVWWSDGQGWYGQESVPAEFALIYKCANFGVFLYVT